MTGFYRILKAIILDPTMTDEEKSDLIEDFMADYIDEFDLAKKYGITL